MDRSPGTEFADSRPFDMQGTSLQATIDSMVGSIEVGVHTPHLDLLKDERNTTGTIGITMSSSMANSLTPMHVMSVLVGGPAYISGQIAQGDEIIAVDGKRTQDKEALLDQIRTPDLLGSTVLLTVKRGNMQLDVPLVRTSAAHVEDVSTTFELLKQLSSLVEQMAPAEDFLSTLQTLILHTVDMERNRLQYEEQLSQRLSAIQDRLERKERLVAEMIQEITRLKAAQNSGNLRAFSAQLGIPDTSPPQAPQNVAFAPTPEEIERQEKERAEVQEVKKRNEYLEGVIATTTQEMANLHNKVEETLLAKNVLFEAEMQKKTQELYVTFQEQLQRKTAEAEALRSSAEELQASIEDLRWRLAAAEEEVAAQRESMAAIASTKHPKASPPLEGARQEVAEVAGSGSLEAALEWAEAESVMRRKAEEQLADESRARSRLERRVGELEDQTAQQTAARVSHREAGSGGGGGAGRMAEGGGEESVLQHLSAMISRVNHLDDEYPSPSNRQAPPGFGLDPGSEHASDKLPFHHQLQLPSSQLSGHTAGFASQTASADGPKTAAQTLASLPGEDSSLTINIPPSPTDANPSPKPPAVAVLNMVPSPPPKAYPQTPPVSSASSSATTETIQPVVQVRQFRAPSAPSVVPVLRIPSQTSSLSASVGSDPIGAGGQAPDSGKRRGPGTLGVSEEEWGLHTVLRALGHATPPSSAANQGPLPDTTRGRKAGVGMLLHKPSGTDFPYVKDIVPGGAADRDGRIRKGEVLLAIDEAPVEGLALHTVVEKISGLEGTTLSLTLQRVRDTGVFKEVYHVVLIREVSSAPAAQPPLVAESSVRASIQATAETIFRPWDQSDGLELARQVSPRPVDAPPRTQGHQT